MPTVLTETTGGWVRGSVLDGVRRFKGIPYAADSSGPHRFQPPRRTNWSGVRDAFAFGPRSPQNASGTPPPFMGWLQDPGPQAEDCLVLNVFAPQEAGSAPLPVMVYLHGGGFAIGSSGAPGLDGGNLARQGVVVVTVNHRLNLFGHLDLSHVDAGRYAYSGNVGLLDLVMALQWVQENAAAFGGDPACVTVFGQSGGGSKVAALMAMPQARQLFHRAIVQSASSLLALAEPEQAKRNTWHFLRTLGLNASDVGALHTLPVPRLLQAMKQTVGEQRRDHFRPVAGGACLPHQPFAAENAGGRVPLLIGWCENEQRLTFASQPAIYALDEHEARARTAALLQVPLDEANRLFDAYHKAHPGDSPGDLYTRIVGDQRYRRSVTRAAEQHAALGAAPVYMYLFNWQSPVMDGLLGAAHTLCLPFVFGNVDVAQGVTGDGEERHALRQQMQGAWVAFARHGNPGHPGLGPWPPYDTAQRPTMVFGRAGGLQHDPLARERIAFEPYPRYDPARGEGELRADAAKREAPQTHM